MKPAYRTSNPDILVGISSGADSTFALIKLKDLGFNPLAILLLTGYNNDAILPAKEICKKLDIKLETRDISEEFQSSVIDKAKAIYEKGITPNPCLICNRSIKFHFLFKLAEELEIPFIGTGHYAQIINKDGELRLAEAKDTKKDQSYFLYELLNRDIARIKFPLGDMLKKDVKKEVEKCFPFLKKNESQDLCFVKKNYRAGLFKGKTNPGPIIDNKGRKVGTHKGLWNYTIGQREKLPIRKPGPWYVYKIDNESNTLFVGPKDLCLKKDILFSLEAPVEMGRVNSNIVLRAKIRYNQEKLDVSSISEHQGNVAMELKQPAFAPAPGQAAVLYEDNLVFCGGTILK